MMGMESYYITLNVQDLKPGDSITQLFKQKYSLSKYKMPSGKLFKKSIVDDSRFVIDNKAVVAVDVMHNEAEITFELCFSNYESNLSYIYNVIKWTSSLGKVAKLKILNSEYDFSNLDYKKFKTIVSQSFCVKMSKFNEHYGKINADILPHDFYNWIRRMGVKGKS